MRVPATIILSVCLVTLVVHASLIPAMADPIFLDETHENYIDLEFLVPTSVTLIPGTLAFIPAQIRNIGTSNVTFKPYDPTNPIGGFGWDFNTPGMALGDFGLRFSINCLQFVVAMGHVDPLIPTVSPCNGEPNFSHLSNVTIAPGETVTFDYFTFLLKTASSGFGEGGAQIAFGDTIYAGYNSAASFGFVIQVTAGSAFSIGPFQQVALTNFRYQTRIGVSIDIKPGEFPNNLNLKSKGKEIPVAILSTAEFDAPNRVDESSLTFGRTGEEASVASCAKPEDVNGDGLLDLVCNFKAETAAFADDDEQGILRGLSVEGIPLAGAGPIVITGTPALAVPTSKEDCKNGGWKTFDFPRTFKNQGDCVQFVNTGK